MLLIVIGYTVVEVRMMLRKGVFSHVLSKNLPHMLNLVLFYVATYAPRRCRREPHLSHGDGLVLVLTQVLSTACVHSTARRPRGQFQRVH